ncbi:MAG: ABC transporter permease [Lachnospiraceae bacterium]|nr:ABC transporter permease [Lachnospiraceae bacterium]
MAQLFENIKMALMNIKNNKGRSILTMLGIIIGISSVIMIISIGNGIKGQVNDELNSFAGGQLYLQGNEMEDGSTVEFTLEDFEAIEEKIAHVKGVSPSYYNDGTAYGTRGEFAAAITAGTTGLEYVSTEAIVKGRYFTEADVENSNKVCIIRESSAKTMFGTTDVVGKTFELSSYGASIEMTIIGIRADNASALLGGMLSYGEGTVELEMPITTFCNALGFYVDSFYGFYIVTEGPEYANDVAKAAIRLMENRHDVRGKDAIYMENFNDTMSEINSVLGYITVFVVFVAAISLLVGGIGVMNIMLVSVTERTREIGIRKALGARTGAILLQFLSESAVITLIGGIIGIILGVSGAFMICGLIGFSAKVEAGTVILASLFSSAVGIFFGIYPAKRAAKLSPIEALRHE